jgi:regulator of sigma E protease
MEILLNIVYYIVPFIVLLGVLVFVHEFGHFIVARLSGVQVSAFSIGFGKEIWSHTDKHGTAWKLSVVPLGGYCQFLGDADASSSTEAEALEKLTKEEKEHAFAFQQTWKKLLIVVAGPLFNYLFAMLVFVALFYFMGRVVYPPVVGSVLEGEAAEMAGIAAGDRIISINGNPTPDFTAISSEVALSKDDNIKVVVERPLNVTLTAEEIDVPNLCGEHAPKLVGIRSLPAEKDKETGENIEPPAEVGYIVPDSPADRAGLQQGDIVKSIDGVELQKFKELREYIAQHQDNELALEVIRPLTFDVTLKDSQYDDGKGNKVKRRMLGIMSLSDITFVEKDMSFMAALQAGGKETWDLTVTTLRSVGQLITGSRGSKEVGGIIRIAEISGDISKTGGFIGFVYFMALLSVNLGLINLLPIPVLDGGHIVIFLGEIITRRRLKPEVKEWIFKIGLLIILAIMVLATWNDVSHLISRWFD